MTNYTVTDVYGVLTGFVLFVPFALFPGYVIGWVSNALQFRSRSIGEKLLIAVPMSISAVPLLIYLTGRFGSIQLTWTLFGLTSAAFAVLFARDLRFGWRSLAGAGLPALVAIGWIFV